MKPTVLFFSKASGSACLIWNMLLLILLTTATPIWAQQSALPCNKDGSTPFVAPTFPANALAVSTTANGGIGVAYWENNSNCTFGFPLGCGSTNIADNVINANTTDFARVHIAGVVASARLRVTESVNEYSAGNFAGFVIKNSSLVGADLFGSVTIATYNNGAFVQQSTSSTLLGVSSSILSGAYEVGFITTQPFDAIEIRFNGLVSAEVYDVYYAVQRKFCAGPTPDCNVKTSLVTSSTASAALGYPAAVNRLGSTGISTFFINNANNITDSDINNAATIGLGIGLGSSAFVSVKDQVGEYTNTFAGFEISNSSLVGVKLLSNITITAYNNNTLVQAVSGSSLLAGVSFLNNNRQIIGFVPNGTFDEVEISFNSVASADVSTTSIYRAVIERFCTAPTPVCKILTPLTSPTYPVYVNNQRTGIDATGCLGCSITNTENVIDAAATTPATINLLASANSSARFSVANAVDTYPAGTFAGFEISSSVLANINLAGSVRITLYNNGTPVQTGSGTNLLAGATVATGTTSQTVGTVGQVPFDEVQIEFNQLLSANLLGAISIYRAVIQASCPTAIACNQTIPLTTGTTSAVIEGARTGFSGVADINGSSILNPWNAVSPSTTDYATITNLASLGVTGSISIADPATVYPSGTFAGFTIRKGSFLLSGSLFPSLTVETYLDGVLQESKAGNNNLLDLSIFIQIFGSSSTTAPYNVGFYTTKPFDEIRLSVGSLLNALAQSVDVYGAFVDTRFSSNGGSLVCNSALNPDFNVTTINVPVSGNVSTNDRVAAGVVYGTPTPAGTNPTGATITLNPDGTYNFTATNVGSYTYTVPVCSSGQSLTSCLTSPLIITVLDPTVTTNPPVANPDYASVQSATATPGSVTINVRANDGPGNLSGSLDPPTIVGAPSHGTASVDGSGNLVYTPTAGYTGDDVLTYQVCEKPGNLCATALVVVHVIPAGSNTIAVVDDYTKTLIGTPVSGNVLTNDQGTNLTVSTAGTITVAGKGTLVINADGTYTFTPVPGVTGPVDFTYTACSNSIICNTATLHILVTPAPDLTPVIYARPSTVHSATDITVVVDVIELKGIATGGPITVLITKDVWAPLTFNGSATLVGGRSVQNMSWNFDGTSNPGYYVLTTNQPITGGGMLSFGLEGRINPSGTNGNITLSSGVDGGSGSELRVNNNVDADKIDYFQL